MDNTFLKVLEDSTNRILKVSKKQYKKPEKVGHFNYIKTKNIYRAANNYFDANTCRAYSYNWWRYVDKIDNIVIFNTYNYSVSTSKHQNRMRDLLWKLNIKYVEIISPDGLQDLDSAIRFYTYEIKKLDAAIKNPKTHSIKNIERRDLISLYKNKIKLLKTLMKGK